MFGAAFLRFDKAKLQFMQCRSIENARNRIANILFRFALRSESMHSEEGFIACDQRESFFSSSHALCVCVCVSEDRET